MPAVQFLYGLHNNDRDAFNAQLDEDAADAAEQLARSERGTAALRAISEWLATGGIGLDGDNQRAVLTLLIVAWRRPSATDNAIVKALTR